MSPWIFHGIQWHFAFSSSSMVLALQLARLSVETACSPTAVGKWDEESRALIFDLWTSCTLGCACNIQRELVGQAVNSNRGQGLEPRASGQFRKIQVTQHRK